MTNQTCLFQVLTDPCQELILYYQWRNRFTDQVVSKINSDNMGHLKVVEVAVLDNTLNFYFWGKLLTLFTANEASRTKDDDALPTSEETFIRFRYRR